MEFKPLRVGMLWLWGLEMVRVVIMWLVLKQDSVVVMWRCWMLVLVPIYADPALWEAFSQGDPGAFLCIVGPQAAD